MIPSQALERHRTDIRRIVERHRARNARVFGSVLNSRDDEDSDLDLLIDATGETTLFDLGAIQFGHIAQAIDRVERYTAGVAQAAFLANEEKQDAVIRNFGIIAEAAANIARHHPDFIAKHPAFRWQDAYGMRNVLTHGYFKIDLDLVWRTAGSDLCALKAMIHAMLAELPDGSNGLS